MSPLRLKMPVADSYYFVAHDYMAGRRRLDRRVLGIGLAAALLGELVVTGVVAVSGERLYVLHESPPDRLLYDINVQLLGQPQHRDLPTWLAFLAVTAEAKVTERMQASRRLDEVELRRVIGKRRALMPADVNEAAWQALRLERALTTAADMTHADLFLAGIVQATGLLPHVLWNPDTSNIGNLVLSRVLPLIDPSLLAIVRQTEAAVGRSVLAPR